MKIGSVFIGMGMAVVLAGGTPVRLYAADNTQTNKQDRSASEPTADQAKNNSSDIETMRQIRKSIVDDKSLSTYAHNVKVISRDGHVTLKGTVHTEAEKSSIEAKASAVVGTENVTNSITVKGS